MDSRCAVRPFGHIPLVFDHTCFATSDSRGGYNCNEPGQLVLGSSAQPGSGEDTKRVNLADQSTLMTANAERWAKSLRIREIT